ncbi:hypothetical protein QL285_056364 [Trifolium repens]|nr:hypothetical protein QL285_056364 [Trifolium repens]
MGEKLRAQEKNRIFSYIFKENLHIVLRWTHRSAMSLAAQVIKTINRASLLHNYSFRNLENYFSIRSKGGGALGKELSPFNGKGNFLRKVARLLICIYLILVI